MTTEYLHRKFELSAGDVVEVNLEGNAANVVLLDESNFHNYRQGQPYTFHGSLRPDQPVPHSGSIAGPLASRRRSGWRGWEGAGVRAGYQRGIFLKEFPMWRFIEAGMAMSRCLVAALVLWLSCAGCKGQKPVPTYPRPVAMRVILEETPGLVPKQREVEIQPIDIDKVYELVKPTRWYEEKVHRSMQPIVARIISTHPDGSTTELSVRWTGQNPAIVSLNDTEYYWADSGFPGDGAVQLIRLLEPGNHLLSGQ